MTYISALQHPCECTDRGVIEPLLEAVEADPLKLPVPDISCQLEKKINKIDKVKSPHIYDDTIMKIKSNRKGMPTCQHLGKSH